MLELRGCGGSSPPYPAKRRISMKVFHYAYETEEGKHGSGEVEAETFEEVIAYINTLVGNIPLTYLEITPIK